MARFNSILETVGHTPVIRVRRLAPSHVSLHVKVEAMNPLGSVKDRLALGLIEDAERTGRLKPGQGVIEATSGNTGIGLAMVCAAKGYPLVVVMGENFSVERRKLMRFLGARVVLTPAADKGTGMVAKAVELAEKHGWFLCRQFENEANADVHSKTTAREILDDFAGERLDYWVTGAGTGGTLKGVGRVLRAERPETKIILCEPDNSPMLSSGVRQPRGPDGAPSGSHPLFRPHTVQGWTPDFIPKLTEDALAEGLVDRVVAIGNDDALRLSRELAQREGIFTGISGGATFAGALAVAEAAPDGAVILCMLPDTGERYLSTPLFEQIGADMSPEERAISDSTPACRFGAARAVAPTAVTTSSVQAEALAQRLIEDPAQPVVMFAFEWCEFCWSVRRFFSRAQIPHRTVDIDSQDYQKEDLGSQLRAAITKRSGSPTIPQIFVGGQFLGGAGEVFAAYKTGRLQELLTANHVPFDRELQLDPDTLLPGWLQSQGDAAGPACAVPPARQRS